jgi:RNA polymerase sigma-70 factor (ECF subfamily)
VPDATSVLIEAYLAKRAELVRFFTMRLRSAEAAEDLVQDIYVRLKDAAPASVSNPGAFLYRLGWNLMLDRLRSQRRSERRDDEWSRLERCGGSAGDASNAPSQEEALASRQRLERLIKGLDRLPTQTRKVFVMHKFDGLPHAEVARRLGISRSAVEKHVSTALRRLLERDL